MVDLAWTEGRGWGAARRMTVEDVIVRRLRAAGTIVVGTTVMHEKGVQPTGYNSHYGGPFNPYDFKRFTGGSSSGSAVAVATGMVPVAIGFDGPAAWSGTVGLAVGFGRIPFSGTGVNLASVVKGVLWRLPSKMPLIPFSCWDNP